MRFASFLTFFLYFSFFCLAAQPHAAMELRGRVVDAERNPMVGAQVQLFEVGKNYPLIFGLPTDVGSFCSASSGREWCGWRYGPWDERISRRS